MASRGAGAHGFLPSGESALAAGEVLIEKSEKLGEGPDGESIMRYSYTLREDLADLVRKHFDVTGPPGRPGIDEAAQIIKDRSREVLEVAATRVYLEQEGLAGSELEK